jgi:hypothetical protein
MRPNEAQPQPSFSGNELRQCYDSHRCTNLLDDPRDFRRDDAEMLLDSLVGLTSLIVFGLILLMLRPEEIRQGTTIAICDAAQDKSLA